ncbi:MAG: hypothetical protein D6780_06280, partial [Candidatus Dadabacteria bacterium]
GHVLLEDYPGSGKTLLTKTLGKLIKKDDDEDPMIAPFKRIQFTPDMLPNDVLGVNVFDAKSSTFRFVPGPVFAHIVLADELNRTGPKVQAAFLECMAEKQVTLDNVTYKLDPLFFVVGTQNPLDLAGTYPLPLVQLDRFLFKVPMSYVDKETEINIVANHNEIMDSFEDIAPVCKRSDILKAREAVRSVTVSKRIIETIVDIVQATRTSPLLRIGASTRAAIMLQQAIRAKAVVEGRDYAEEDDLKSVLPYTLSHRIKASSSVTDPEEALWEIATPYIEKLIRAV